MMNDDIPLEVGVPRHDLAVCYSSNARGHCLISG